MDRVTAPTAASADIGTTVTTAAAWVRVWSWRGRAGEKPCRDHLDELPSGSGVVDLRKHGLVIGVGGLGAGARMDCDAVR